MSYSRKQMLTMPLIALGLWVALILSLDAYFKAPDADVTSESRDAALQAKIDAHRCGNGVPVQGGCMLHTGKVARK